MFYDIEQAKKACKEEPSLIFELIKEGHIELVDELLTKKNVDINTTDEFGNTVLMRLLKNKNYDVVLRHMKNKDWSVNHQNNDGDTFGHILAGINYVNVIEIINVLRKNKTFMPNIKNNKDETMLDKSINANYIYTAAKILEDSRFDNMDILSFKKYYEAYIRNNNYGKYTKLMNLEILVDNLEERPLLPRMKKLIHYIHVNFDTIKEELLNDNTKRVDYIVYQLLEENY